MRASLYLSILGIMLFSIGTTFANANTRTGASTSNQPSERISIKVNLSEMKFQVEGEKENTPLALKVGQAYRLVFENIGTIRHEIHFGKGINRTDENEDPEGYVDQLFNNFNIAISGANLVNGKKNIWEIETQSLKEIELDSGTRLALYFKLPESIRGNWEIGCFQSGHYQMGMKLPVVIQ